MSGPARASGGPRPRLPKHLFRLMAMCVALVLPIGGGVAYAMNASRAKITALEREIAGLEAAIRALQLLDGIERYRILVGAADARAAAVSVRAGRAVDAELAALSVPLLRDAGPRTNVKELRTRWRAVIALPSPPARARATVSLAQGALALLLDIGDLSGLTYDPTVESINLSDALIARLPGQVEARDRAAEIIEAAVRRGALRAPEIIAAEQSSGEAHDALAAAWDDFDGAALALPALEPVLHADREALERDARALSSAIDAIVITPSATRSAAIDRLRLASIAANDRLFDASDAILARSFRLRIAGYEIAIVETIGFGVLGAIVGCAALVLVWRALQRHDERELAHAQERAATLEAQLARRNAEAALELTEQQFRAVFDQSPVGIGIIERGRSSVDANATLRTLFDDDLAQIEFVARQMFAEIESGQATARRAEHRFDFAGRPSLWADVSLSLIFGGRSSRAPRAMVMVHNVTEYKTLHAQLDHQTLHDALTGLPNRTFFTRRLAALTAARDEAFEVVFIDLDRFKSVNDTLGHHAGDDVLVAVASRLLATVRANDVVARLHGDEFALLLLGLTDRDSSELEEIAARIVLGLRLFVGDAANPIMVSASMGIVRSQTQPGGPEEYLRAADAAMYHSKMKGGDCFTIFDPTMTAIGPG